jgi:hypothetical protein
MNDTGFWEALAHQFEEKTGIHVEAVATGPKDGISAVFKQGGIDLITMHASDTLMNLIADGYAMDPQPWARSDMILVGPSDDPAGIKGMTDAAAALRKIAQTKSSFVVHSSLGAQEVLRGLLESGDIQLDPEHTTILFDDRQRRVLPNRDGEKGLHARWPDPVSKREDPQRRNERDGARRRAAAKAIRRGDRRSGEVRRCPPR